MIRVKEETRHESKTICEQHNFAYIIQLILLIITGLTIYISLRMDYKSIEIFKGLSDKLDHFKMMFLYPYSHSFTLWNAVQEIMTTLGLALFATLSGGLISLGLGLLTAQDMYSKHISNIIKGLVTIIRPVPTILWVFIFAVSTELGSVAALIGMTFHSIGYLSKPYFELFQNRDRRVCFNTHLIAWSYMRFQINFAYAISMSVVAGAGEIGVMTYLILAIAILLETGSMNKVR